MKCVNELKAGNDEFKEAHDSILAKLKSTQHARSRYVPCDLYACSW